jgi:hypothetical protein
LKYYLVDNIDYVSSLTIERDDDNISIIANDDDDQMFVVLHMSRDWQQQRVVRYSIVAQRNTTQHKQRVIIMTTQTITYDDMTNYIMTNETQRDVMSIDVNETFDEIRETIMHFALSCTSRVDEYLRVACSFDIRDDAIAFDANKLKYVDAFTLLISNEYDCECNNMWDAFDLSSDDDVDYNASYIDIIVDLLRDMIKQ